MTNQEQQQEVPESKVAKWAYRLALIPILGFFLYILLALFSLIRIGKGQTGFHLLRLGLFRMLRMTTVGIIGFCLVWFLPSYTVVSSNIGNYYTKEYGYVLRGFDFSCKKYRMWQWETYDNDILSEQVEYWFGDKHGKYIRYGYEGKIAEEGYYKYDRREGEWKGYYSGDISWQGKFKNGNPVGIWKEERTNYYDGKAIGCLKGDIKYGGPAGDGAYEVYVIDNMPTYYMSPFSFGRTGFWKIWYEAGRRYEGNYQDASPVGKWIIYENDIKREEGEFIGVREGVWIFWNESGLKESEITYKNGIRMEHKAFSQEGKMKSYGVVREKIPDDEAIWTTWFNNGNKQSVKTYILDESYRASLKHGIWTFWFPSGQKESEFIYDNGSLSESKHWWQSGKVKSVEKWTGGKEFEEEKLRKFSLGDTINPAKLGLCLYYNEQGVLIKETRYDNDKIIEDADIK